MKIGPRKILQNGDEVTIFAQVEHSANDLPEALWFTFPSTYYASHETNGNAFIAGLLLTAMSRSEPLYIDDQVDGRLLNNLAKVQRYFNRWRPDWYSPIELRATSVTRKVNTKPAPGVLFPFSGGADSFYCLYSNSGSQERNKVEQVSHAFFVHGFDIPLHDVQTYKAALYSYQKLMNSLGVVLIPVQTNVREFHNTPDWDAGAITAVCSVALLFENIAGRFYYPEINTYDYQPKSGGKKTASYFFQNPVAELLSTDRLATENRGGDISKIDKISAIAHWPITFGRLRVCWENPHGLQNCGECNKCLLTMSALEIEGALSKHNNFKTPLARARVRKMYFPNNRLYFPRTWRKYAYQKNHLSTTFDMHIVVLKSTLKWYSHSVYRNVNVRTHLFRLSAYLKRHSTLYAACVSSFKKYAKLSSQ